ncbi:hypothetical protein NIIDMKKI_02820 [Mycobacterium kansasii]|uniref:Uncharacterized protein n=1 Tax=Mycobacterium kansasii TaxID=1768 RepID=A0A7G1I1Z7_MYCKA|nr:hypothetical protein NIIDMKKI_02820 [Mycobacterium kansasii]
MATGQVSVLVRQHSRQLRLVEPVQGSGGDHHDRVGAASNAIGSGMRRRNNYQVRPAIPVTAAADHPSSRCVQETA